MRRERAVELLEGLLARVVAGEGLLDAVQSVWVFGSFARGALAPADVDIDVEYRPDDRFPLYRPGVNPHSPLRKDLLGGRRGVQVQFGWYRQLDKQGFELKLLYERGDDLDTALGRLAAIEPDPAAGPAQRDHMLPAFEGLEKYLSKPVREALVELVEAGALAIDQVEVPDRGPIDDPYWDVRVDNWWTPDGPRWRAAHAALHYFSATGRDLRTIDIHDNGPLARYGTEGSIASARFGIGQGLDQLPQRMSHPACEEWLIIANLTKTRPLTGLQVRPLDKDKLRERRWLLKRWTPADLDSES